MGCYGLRNCLPVPYSLYSIAFAFLFCLHLPPFTSSFSFSLFILPERSHSRTSASEVFSGRSVISFWVVKIARMDMVFPNSIRSWPRNLWYCFQCFLVFRIRQQRALVFMAEATYMLCIICYLIPHLHGSSQPQRLLQICPSSSPKVARLIIHPNSRVRLAECTRWSIKKRPKICYSSVRETQFRILNAPILVRGSGKDGKCFQLGSFLPLWMRSRSCAWPQKLLRTSIRTEKISLITKGVADEISSLPCARYSP